jgi:hypothetical protein
LTAGVAGFRLFPELQHSSALLSTNRSSAMLTGLEKPGLVASITLPAGSRSTFLLFSMVVARSANVLVDQSWCLGHRRYGLLLMIFQDGSDRTVSRGA